MSRFDGDGFDDSEYAALNEGRWEHNVKQALNGKRGQKSLRDLRDALLALPVKRLGTGVLCQVGEDGKALFCSIGAMAWHKGEELIAHEFDPDESYEYEEETLAMAEKLGFSRTLAVETAYNNDEWASATPELRYTAVLDWVNHQLKGT